MSPDDFRKAALHLKGAEERVKWAPGFSGQEKEFRHPWLSGYPDEATGMVRLTLEH